MYGKVLHEILKLNGHLSLYVIFYELCPTHWYISWQNPHSLQSSYISISAKMKIAFAKHSFCFSIVRPLCTYSLPQTCNGNVYLHVSPEDMRKAWDRKVQLMKANYPALPRPRQGNPKKYPVNSRLSDLSSIKFDPIDIDHVTTTDGVPLQVATIPREVTNQVPLFYCCASCGKIFWEGKHFDDVCNQFADVLNRNVEKDVSDDAVSNTIPDPDLASALKGKLTFKWAHCQRSLFLMCVLFKYIYFLRGISEMLVICSEPSSRFIHVILNARIVLKGHQLAPAFVCSLCELFLHDLHGDLVTGKSFNK